MGAVAIFSAGGIKGFYKKTPNPACFVAGTMILTAAGLVAIENIKARDKVVSTNADTFETAEKSVLETYIREVSMIVHLTINSELISTTVNHPFYVKNQGFINAGELQIGNKVVNSNGEIYSVENIDVEIVENPVKVYNFQVEDFHTYHVGNSGVLVHNKCDLNAGKPGSPEWKKTVKAMKEGKGKGINANVETEAQARQLIKDARPGLKEYDTYNGTSPGFEVHPIEAGINKNLPHIKWKDWSLGRSGGAEGHIFYTWKGGYFMKGLITETHLKKDVLDKFIEKFVKNGYAFRNPITGFRQLIWCYFRDECQMFSTEELFQSQLKISTSVYFYNERTEEMFLTDFEDVRNFINNFEPWDEVDAEIFNDSLEWVIAVTHEDVSKVFGLSVTIDEYSYEKEYDARRSV